MEPIAELLQSKKHLIVIGGGAAGFFCAINAARLQPMLRVTLVEKTSKLLSKVRVSGGGRCNVTHNCFEPTPLSKHYPRGQKELKNVFRQFQAVDTVKWFEKNKLPFRTGQNQSFFLESPGE